jgi:hypothetical protein
MAYNRAGVAALEKVEEAVTSFRLPPTKARKFNSILGAIETQIEDYEYSQEVVSALLRALVGLADFYELATGRDKLVAALMEFELKLQG